MQLKFDWLIVLETCAEESWSPTRFWTAQRSSHHLCQPCLAQDDWLRTRGNGLKTPRILQGKHTDQAVVGSLKQKLLNREVFHGQTWNYRKSGEPFLMNWYAIPFTASGPNRCITWLSRKT